jgi:prevent-host-death family protein
MAVIGIRQLSRETSRVIQDFEETGEPVIVTREGRPIGALVPVGEMELEDLVLGMAPEFRPGHDRTGAPVEEEGISLEDAAAERGIALDEESPEGEAAPAPAAQGQDFVEMGWVATEAELRPLAEILSQPLAGQVLTEANNEIESVSGEVLKAVSGENPDADEVGEVTSATAAFYGRVLRHYLPRALRRAMTPDNLLEATRSTSKVVRAVNKPLIETPNFSIEGYRPALRSMEIAWESGVEGEETVEGEEAVEETAPVSESTS